MGKVVWWEMVCICLAYGERGVVGDGVHNYG